MCVYHSFVKSVPSNNTSLTNVHVWSNGLHTPWNEPVSCSGAGKPRSAGNLVAGLGAWLIENVQRYRVSQYEWYNEDPFPVVNVARMVGTIYPQMIKSSV